MRLLVCGLIALGQVVAFAHIGLSEHRVCATHGKMVHGRHVTAKTDQVAASPSIARSAEVSLDEEHDHCAIVAFGRERSMSAPPQHEDACLSATVTIRESRLPHDGAFAIALISLAPKHSPPA